MRVISMSAVADGPEMKVRGCVATAAQPVNRFRHRFDNLLRANHAQVAIRHQRQPSRALARTVRQNNGSSERDGNAHSVTMPSQEFRSSRLAARSGMNAKSPGKIPAGMPSAAITFFCLCSAENRNDRPGQGSSVRFDHLRVVVA